MPNDIPDWTAPGQPVAVLSTSQANATGTGSFTLPPGTQSLAIVTVVQSGDRSNFSLTGHTSGFGYYSQALGDSAYEIIGVEQTTDSQLDFSAQSVSGPGVNWYVTALPYPPPDFILRTAAPYAVPTKPAPINQNIGFGTSFTWITPPAGRRLRLFYCHWHWRTSARGFGSLKGDGTTGGLFNYDQVATNQIAHDFHGFALQVNEKLLVSNDDTANGQNINGGIEYSLD